ncbi:MAG TPA: YbaY family lipoprotein [Methylophilaceae bacterium]|nr:YbaY family lipoprotein [Methylophilaceae bacterium]
MGNGLVTGTAAYRERIAMPPDAVFEATLEDVSLADAPAKTIGQVRIEALGSPPIHFEIPYDEARIEARHSYAVRARVLRSDGLMFFTDRSYPVLTRGHGKQVSMMMHLNPGPGSGKNATDEQVIGPLPASFAGDLPCADCQGIRYQLDLFADHAFFLRMSYMGKNRAFDDIGTWSLADGRTLILDGGREARVRFSVKEAATLRKLDQEGREIESALNYDLKREATLQPIEPQIFMGGMYHYMADAGIFTECLTRRRMPVAQVQDNAALERDYVNLRREPGEEIMATLEGRLVMRPKMEGEGLQQVLIVERFIKLWPGESCGAQFSTASLENTYWKLTRLGDVPVTVNEGQREPHLLLRREGRHVGGYGGCNRLMGRYELNGVEITFGNMAMTMMACPSGMDTEQAFHKALAHVKSWKITGEHLELLDAGGVSLARFEAIYMK